MGDGATAVLLAVAASQARRKKFVLTAPVSFVEEIDAPRPLVGAAS